MSLWLGSLDGGEGSIRVGLIVYWGICSLTKGWCEDSRTMKRWYGNNSWRRDKKIFGVSVGNEQMSRVQRENAEDIVASHIFHLDDMSWWESDINNRNTALSQFLVDRDKSSIEEKKIKLQKL